MAGPEAILTALIDFLINNWAVIVIGAFIGVIFSWRRWVPSKFAQIRNAIGKRSYGVLYVRLRSKVFKPCVVDFSSPNGLVKTPFGTFNATMKIGGYQDGVPIAFATQADVDAVPLFKNDYKQEDLINPTDLSDGLDAAFIAGQISQQKEDKMAFHMRVVTLIGIVILGLLIWDQRGMLTGIGTGINNFASDTTSNFAKLLGGAIQKGG